MFQKKRILSRQERRQRVRKIRKTLSKVRVCESELHGGTTRLRARLNIRALQGYYKELESLGLRNNNSLIEQVKAIYRGFRAWL